MAEPMVVVLAAGLSTRFGGDKLEAKCLGKPLGRWVLDAVQDAGLGPGIIVTGPEGVSFANRWWTPLINPRPQDGLGSSVALAARHALAANVTAMLVLLADMPLVFPSFLKALAMHSPPTAMYYPDGHLGVPALLDRRLIEAAANLSGDKGLGPLLRGATAMPGESVLHDVDTPDDLAEVERILTIRSLGHGPGSPFPL
jgi:CTP:molybdopterin cytidylyltransferase MocA